MKKILLLTLALVFLSAAQLSLAKSSRYSEYYGTGLCSKPGYHCIKVKRGGWKKAFPDPIQRDIVQRVNRTNMRLWRGKKIAVPDHLGTLTLHDVSPFPLKIAKRPNKLIIVDQDKLAWGAYDTKGHLLKWGPISSGKDYCGDIGRGCRTQTGAFYVFNKKGKGCESNIFPIGRGGANMPYCMFFYRGFALHGSAEVPGYRASHGCIRLFTRDAEWLNRSFVRVKNLDSVTGTKVVIMDIKNAGGKKHAKKRRRSR
jgi:L,D-transpeptidase ErfK/SrfK